MNSSANHNILRWFKQLDDWNISYYLLRPLDLKKTEKDVDLIMSKSDVKLLAKNLSDMDLGAEVTTSIAENSVGIMVDGDLLLDIKTKICFMPSKFYSFNTSPPYSKIKLSADKIVYPDVEDDVLFTFWIMHFFLDKKHPSLSGSYKIFCDKFSENSSEMISSPFFQKWLHKVFRRKKEDAEYVFRLFCKNNFQTTLELTRFTKELILRTNVRTFITFYLEKAKYAIIRRTTKEFYRPITAYHG